MFFITLISALLLSFVLPGGSEKEKNYDPCLHKLSVWQVSKGALLGARLLDKCLIPIFRKADYTPTMIQKVIFKLCTVFWFCIHKYKDVQKTQGLDVYSRKLSTCVQEMESLLAVQLQPEMFGNFSNRAYASIQNATECAYIHRIATDDVGIALAGARWTRDTLF